MILSWRALWTMAGYQAWHVVRRRVVFLILPGDRAPDEFGDDPSSMRPAGCDGLRAANWQVAGRLCWRSAAYDGA